MKTSTAAVRSLLFNPRTLSLYNRRRPFGQFSSLTLRTQKPLVSAIIPARNEEASIARAVESVAAQPEVVEVIVVNDQSSDRTGEILEGLAARIPKLRVLATGELPRGWTGKNYAVSLGAAVATGDWFVFTDADTYHLPGSTRQALADAAEHSASMVSYSPEQEMESFWERALLLRVYWMLSQRHSFARVNNALLRDAAANGQFVLIQRSAYERIGGHAAVAGEILEDVVLARRVKQATLGLYFASGRGIVRTRMYRSFGAMWQGWTKNLYRLAGNSPWALARELGEGFVVILLLGEAVKPVHGPIDWMILGAALWFLVSRLAGFGAYLRENLFPLAFIQYYIPGSLLYFAALLGSWWKSTHGEVVWKGRVYSAKGL
jgi:glycosyltransferase involved in cell wall biosynthesis